MLIRLILPIIFFLFSFNSFADDAKDAKNYVNDLGNQIINIAKDKSISVDQRRDKLIDLIDSLVDSKWVARFVLARNYRTASQDQRDQFQKLYRDFMIHTYAPSFKGYSGEDFEVLDVMQQGKYFMVKCNFIPKEGPKVNLAFRLKKNKNTGKFAVLDVIAEGVSLIETQRSEFNSVISNKGMDGFLADLDTRVKKLKNPIVANK